MRFFKTITKLTFWLIILVIIVILYCNWRINRISRDYIYTSIEELPHNKVGLVLGTSKYLIGGKPNLYFQYRIETAEELYKNDKIDYIIVSGDNGHISYNEPLMMKKALIAKDIPDSVIYLDYAGFRTFDSIIRCSKIFGQSSFTVISQKFQNQRAIYIGKKKGLNVMGFNAKDVELNYGLKTRFREFFARVKVFMDIYLVNKKPKFLGEQIKIGN